MAMCWLTSSVSSACRVYRTTALDSSAAFSSHSRSTLNPGGPSLVDNHKAIAAAGDVWVFTNVTAKPSTALINQVITSSALAELPASVSSRPAFGSIHTLTLDCLLNAMGSSARRASSLISRFSFLPGLRPVVASMWSNWSCTLRLITEPGTTFTSSISFSSHWPPTTSTSGPLAWPRGSVQPTDFSCEAPHSTKRASSNAASTCSTDPGQGEARRYIIKFLNTNNLF